MIQENLSIEQEPATQALSDPAGSQSVSLYLQEKPAHYVGNVGITFNCKPSERWVAEKIYLHLANTLDGFEFERFNF